MDIQPPEIHGTIIDMNEEETEVLINIEASTLDRFGMDPDKELQIWIPITDLEFEVCWGARIRYNGVKSWVRDPLNRGTPEEFEKLLSQLPDGHS